MNPKSNFTVILFYKFTYIASPAKLVKKHKEIASRLGLLGRVLIANEGINATLEGTGKNIKIYKKFLRTDKRFRDIVVKESRGNGKAFTKLAVKARDEVVTLESGKLNVRKDTAPYITASELEKWYRKNKDFVVLDLRNNYEIAVGKFEKTIDPDMDNFRDLPKKLPKIKKLKNKNVVVVCTGGIRCEKATCLLKKEGFSNLHQLKDGIHTYMKKYPGRNFKGSLFVFDNRMTTDVVETKNKVVVGRCVFCNKATENFCSDDNFRPSKKILCCPQCFKKNHGNLRLSSVV